jgi:protein-tyrosine-phosphatase
MCSNINNIEAKIHTLTGCATGVDSDIADPYGQDMSIYIQVRNQIINNVDLVMKHYAQSRVWCLY